MLAHLEATATLRSPNTRKTSLKVNFCLLFLYLCVFFRTFAAKSLNSMKRVVSFLIIMLLAVGTACAERVVLGAEQTKEYLPLLKGKRVALLSNHTGLIIQEKGDEAIRRKAIPFTHWIGCSGMAYK